MWTATALQSEVVRREVDADDVLGYDDVDVGVDEYRDESDCCGRRAAAASDGKAAVVECVA